MDFLVSRLLGQADTVAKCAHSGDQRTFSAAGSLVKKGAHTRFLLVLAMDSRACSMLLGVLCCRFQAGQPGYKRPANELELSNKQHYCRKHNNTYLQSHTSIVQLMLFVRAIKGKRWVLRNIIT